MEINSKRIRERCCLPFRGHHEVDIQKPRVEAPRRREGCYLSYCLNPLKGVI